MGWGGGLLAPALPNEQRLEVGVRGAGWHSCGLLSLCDQSYKQD